jgi:hypothetical protein
MHAEITDAISIAHLKDPRQVFIQVKTLSYEPLARRVNSTLSITIAMEQL